MKQLKITVNGKAYDVTVEEVGATASVPVQATPAATPVATPAPAAAPAPTAGEGESVCAPMNGNIVDVKVSAGQNVKSGELLIVLEAMKMENEIVAPRDGVVTSVLVNKGETVDTGSALLTLK